MLLPEGAAPLAVGTLLALAGLSIVLSPLLRGATAATDVDDAMATPARNFTGDEQQGSAVAALREIEFDHETGKLSERDYAELKERHTPAALAEIRASRVMRDEANARVQPAGTIAYAPIGGGIASEGSDLSHDVAPSIDDAVEAAIARARQQVAACGVCGPRPEPDAIYCSSCGRYLAESCGRCGAAVELVGSRFCSNCGDQLAAA